MKIISAETIATNSKFINLGYIHKYMSSDYCSHTAAMFIRTGFNLYYKR